VKLGIVVLLAAAAGFAQQPPQPPQPVRSAPAPRPAVAPQPPQPPPLPVRGRPLLERSLGGPVGRWWVRPDMVERLGLTADQQKRMDDIFQQHRLKLIDLNATVQKEEVIMEPLVSAANPDEPKIIAQIDRVAQARAELEKANARMLLDLRRVLTPEQWNKLDAGGPQPSSSTNWQPSLPPGATRPTLLSRVDPQYTDEARSAKFQGTVIVRAEIGPDGVPRNIGVQRSLGMGLDERAIEAVRQWRFNPAMLDGKPISVNATIEVNFRMQ
jgi:TonB family protein